MRPFLCFALLIVCVSISVCGQERETRAKLAMIGYLKRIYVAPDEKLWLQTSAGRAYSAKSINGTWNEQIFPSGEFNTQDIIYASIGAVGFMDHHHAVFTGSISVDMEEKNLVYLTQDNGSNWRSSLLETAALINVITTDPSGRIWMAGRAPEIYYSSDFGRQWHTFSILQDQDISVRSLDMEDSVHGVAGIHYNRIVLTSDNWRSFDAIPTPFDQKRYVLDPEDIYSQNGIEKIRIWGDYYIVKQNGFIYFSKRDHIVWEQLPVAISDFELDKSSGNILAVSKDLRVLLFSSPYDFHYLHDRVLKDAPVDMMALNNAAFIIDRLDNLYRIDSASFIYVNYLPVDKAIVSLETVKFSGATAWGTSDRSLYRSEDTGKNWYLAHTADFLIWNLTVLHDSAVVLGDRNMNNYLYSVSDEQLQQIHPKQPLEKFLHYPIITMTIVGLSSGCFYLSSDEITYTAVVDSLHAGPLRSRGSNGDSVVSDSFTHVEYTAVVSTILNAINAMPEYRPSIADFHITDADWNRFWRSRRYEKGAQREIRRKIETVSDEILHRILDQEEGVVSTSSRHFSVEIVNSNRDTLTLSSVYYHTPKAWHVPWTVTYKDWRFRSYNVDLSRLADRSIPNGFHDKTVFDNALLIDQIVKEVSH